MLTVCLCFYVLSVSVTWTPCSATRPWTQASSDRNDGGVGEEGLTLYSLESLNAQYTHTHTPNTHPPPHQPTTHYSLPPPTPCCIALSARRHWRCTHALPYCVGLCLSVSMVVCVCLFVCTCGQKKQPWLPLFSLGNNHWCFFQICLC